MDRWPFLSGVWYRRRPFVKDGLSRAECPFKGIMNTFVLWGLVVNVGGILSLILIKKRDKSGLDTFITLLFTNSCTSPGFYKSYLL
jgi:hypothetical protein